jgi:hypothetical protein
MVGVAVGLDSFSVDDDRPIEIVPDAVLDGAPEPAAEAKAKAKAPS